jgi:hypothetical protein
VPYRTILVLYSKLSLRGNRTITFRDAPGIDLAGNPGNIKVGYQISSEAGYRISGQIINSIKFLYFIICKKNKEINFNVSFFFQTF